MLTIDFFWTQIMPNWVATNPASSSLNFTYKTLTLLFTNLNWEKVPAKTFNNLSSTSKFQVKITYGPILRFDWLARFLVLLIFICLIALIWLDNTISFGISLISSMETNCNYNIPNKFPLCFLNGLFSANIFKKIFRIYMYFHLTNKTLK